MDSRFVSNVAAGIRARLNSVCRQVRRARARNVTPMLTCGLFCGKQATDVRSGIPRLLIRGYRVGFPDDSSLGHLLELAA